MNKVRAGSVYRYEPVLIDKTAPHLLAVEPGLFVRVVNYAGCPKANTMGHCHVEGAVTKRFLGLVCCNSLVKLTAAEKKVLKKQGTI